MTDTDRLYNLLDSVLGEALGDSGGVEIYLTTEETCGLCDGQGLNTTADGDSLTCWFCGGSGVDVRRIPLMQTLRELMEKQNDSRAE